MERSRRKAARALSGPVRRTRGPVIGAIAETELFEILDYIAKDSPKNAKLVADRIAKAVVRIGRSPHAAGHIDEDVSGVPGGSVARKTAISGYTIRYVFPFVEEGETCALILSIRRGVRKALDDPAYVLRWMEERAKREPTSGR